MAPPTPRTFHVYAGPTLVLTAQDTPGTLRSSVRGGAFPTHPFLDAQAWDAAHEHELRALLLDARSFDGFLRGLIHAGFDLASERFRGSPPGHRLMRDDAPVGAVWERAGRFAALTWPASRPTPHSEHALLTAYTEEHAELLADALQRSSSMDELRALLSALQLRLAPLGA
ncbi:MAG: hypothetical protein CMH57_12955 [Myxococcales bacterium]|nr:hypothetical protein [Myxococcales bacterium]